jgi:hypothetical protein
MTHWDPIGVRNISEAQDEYDSYVGTVYVMLVDGRASEDAIRAYLLKIATEHMGMSFSESLLERCRIAATVLKGLEPELRYVN